MPTRDTRRPHGLTATAREVQSVTPLRDSSAGFDRSRERSEPFHEPGRRIEVIPAPAQLELLGRLSPPGAGRSAGTGSADVSALTSRESGSRGC